MNEEHCSKCGQILAGTENWWRFKRGLCNGHSFHLSDLEKIEDISDEDYFEIVDADKHCTKFITIAQLRNFLKNSSKSKPHKTTKDKTV
jgi:hypothetical protein